MILGLSINYDMPLFYAFDGILLVMLGINYTTN